MTRLLAHSSDLLPQKAYVGLFDVLGFRDRLSNNSLASIVQDYQRLILAKKQSGVVTVFGPAGADKWEIGTTIFSDSILLWCDDSPDPLQTLLDSSAHLLESALNARWPLRGGIAYGDCVLDLATRTFIGQAIVDAYNVEKCQEWMGASLHDTILTHPVTGQSVRQLDSVVAYSVPTKIGSKPLTHAVHWGPYARSAVSRLNAMASLAPALAQPKYQNTISYLRATCRGMAALS